MKVAGLNTKPTLSGYVFISAMLPTFINRMTQHNMHLQFLFTLSLNHLINFLFKGIKVR